MAVSLRVNGRTRALTVDPDTPPLCVLRNDLHLDQTAKPSVAEIKAALANNLYRCGTYAQIVRAVQRVAAARA
ncbi:MAG TPA: 2Fe-2S iron-sulfur cluster-binding protein [Xanthobacteraceae bacterium]|jgi:aerobic-type carbon monoxide dehydrogenase small subunit (CoxS/CutS family)|nr:2Fe-2S iron-sulfur cluster-binding protein [Xanthobacteraceae bacterium]